MYSLSIKETQDVVSIVGREIQLTKDYTTGNATFKQGSRGTVIEATRTDINHNHLHVSSQIKLLYNLSH